jgi:hypothetical protein
LWIAATTPSLPYIVPIVRNQNPCHRPRLIAWSLHDDVGYTNGDFQSITLTINLNAKNVGRAPSIFASTPSPAN